jgi:ATP-dependent RNA helicase SUPV3L1/SUV3
VEADGKIVGDDGVVGQLVRGNELLNPSVRLLLADRADLDRDALQSQLLTQVRAQVADLLAPCQPGPGVPASPAVAGLLYSLRVSLGCVERRTVAAQLSALGADDAEELARRRIALGVRWLYLKARLKPRHAALRAALWNAFRNEAIAVPTAGATFLHAPTEFCDAALLALSHPRVGALGVRVDIAERLLALSHRKDALQAAQRLLGAKRRAAQDVLDALRPRRRRRRRARRAPSEG